MTTPYDSDVYDAAEDYGSDYDEDLTPHAGYEAMDGLGEPENLSRLTPPAES